MHIRTIGPVTTPLYLLRALDPRAEDYDMLLDALPPDSAELKAPNRQPGARRAYFARSDTDDLDLRLLVWRPPATDGVQVTIHLYPTGVAILETEQASPPLTTRREVEQLVQQRAHAAFTTLSARFTELLMEVLAALPPNFAAVPPDDWSCTGEDIGWISRALILKDAERKNVEFHPFLREWLSTTARPEEADQLIRGTIKSSMTWLNYVLVDGQELEDVFSAARSAQFFYAAQNTLNLLAQEPLGRVAQGEGLRQLERQLMSARQRMQQLRILYETQKGFLSRQRRRKFDDLMKVWDFKELVENGERIISASSDRIGEITSRRSERSTTFTDAILFGIALFTIVETSLLFLSYSREMMSRPALGYTDSQMSWILRAIAAVDADAILLGGTLLSLILILLYAYWKSRR